MKWIENFLSNRTFTVNVNGAFPFPIPVKTGVPEGSCLGPILFAIFVNDLPAVFPEDVRCEMYADDLKIYSFSNPGSLKYALKSLESWSKKWKLPISAPKTLVMHIGRNNPKVGYILNDATVTKVSIVKDLEISYTDTLI